ncbi:MAG: GntR family transcriptional regulator [Leptotrichiaceae bacterium]|nr:GntR family transcriptional regulator [Leptotrichiaceae bacterium]
MKKKLDILAYEYVKNKIINNEYKEREIIHEKKIAEELSISKTPVKEALSQLENENFVIINPRKSVSVTEIDLKLIKDVFQVRSRIEPLLVELTILFLDRTELKSSLLDFRKKFEKMGQKNKVSGVEFDKLYGGYKYFFAENCGNFFFSRQMTLVYDHLERIRKVLYGPDNRRLEAIEEHIDIIDLILNDEISIETIKELCEKHVEAAQMDFFKNLNNLNI